MLPAFHTPVVFSDKEFKVTRLIIRGLHLNYKVKAMAHLHGLVVATVGYRSIGNNYNLNSYIIKDKTSYS